MEGSIKVVVAMVYSNITLSVDRTVDNSTTAGVAAAGVA